MEQTIELSFSEREVYALKSFINNFIRLWDGADPETHKWLYQANEKIPYIDYDTLAGTVKEENETPYIHSARRDKIKEWDKEKNPMEQAIERMKNRDE